MHIRHPGWGGRNRFLPSTCRMATGRQKFIKTTRKRLQLPPTAAYTNLTSFGLCNAPVIYEPLFIYLDFIMVIGKDSDADHVQNLK